MSRGKKRIVRPIVPDSKYNSILISKFINAIMEDGKKEVAEKIVYSALEQAKNKLVEKFGNVADGFKEVIMLVGPTIQTKTRRVGGSNYQVPIEVTPARAQALALKWLTTYSRERNGRSMADNLANEIIDASNGTGATVKKREDTHRMAEANKAYAHYRW